MIIKANGYCFFDRNSIGSKRKLQKYYGVKNNSFAGNTIARLYKQYFGNAYRVRKIYKKFYRKEFPSCKDFLICRFNLSSNLAQEVVEKKLFYTNMEMKIDEISDSFYYDEELVNLFKQYVGGVRNENTDSFNYDEELVNSFLQNVGGVRNED